MQTLVTRPWDRAFSTLNYATKWGIGVIFKAHLGVTALIFFDINRVVTKEMEVMIHFAKLLNMSHIMLVKVLK